MVIEASSLLRRRSRISWCSETLFWTHGSDRGCIVILTIPACLEYALFLTFSIFKIVRSDRVIEQLVYPVPQICEFLTESSKVHVYKTTERNEHGSKVKKLLLLFMLFCCCRCCYYCCYGCCYCRNWTFISFRCLTFLQGVMTYLMKWFGKRN